MAVFVLLKKKNNQSQNDYGGVPAGGIASMEAAAAPE